MSKTAEETKRRKERKKRGRKEKSRRGDEKRNKREEEFDTSKTNITFTYV